MTAGYDGNVVLWDAVAHVDLWVVHLNGQVYHEKELRIRIF